MNIRNNFFIKLKSQINHYVTNNEFQQIQTSVQWHDGIKLAQLMAKDALSYSQTNNAYSTYLFFFEIKLLRT